MYEKELLMVAGGGAAGVAQTYLLSRFVDTDANGATVNLIPQIGSFGKPSAIVGIGAGAAALGLSIFAMKTGKFIPDPRIQYAVAAYGGSALVTGVLAGLDGLPMLPASAPRRVVANPRGVPQGVPRAAYSRFEDNIL